MSPIWMGGEHMAKTDPVWEATFASRYAARLLEIQKAQILRLILRRALECDRRSREQDRGVARELRSLVRDLRRNRHLALEE